jgi:septal ring factor EnvC (AmiA/AmiB activator)
MSITDPLKDTMVGGMMNGELKIPMRLAVILQLVMMAAGAGATYTATRAAVEMDKQRIEDQSKAISALQTSMQSSQQTLSSLTTSIDYLTAEVKSMQERLWNDRRTRY